MRYYQTSHSANSMEAVLRTSSFSHKIGLKAATIAVVACLHVAGLYWALVHTSNVIKVPDQQPSTITFELNAPPQPKVEAPGPVASAPPAPRPEPKQTLETPVKPSRSIESKKKPVEKKPVEKKSNVAPKPTKPVLANAPAVSAPATPATSVASTPLPTTETDNGASSSTAPAGTGGQQIAAVPAQIGRFQANNPRPKYPMQARRQHLEGLVILTVRISEDGRVTDARIKRSSGHDVLDDSALETVRLWRFEPGHQGGKATASETNVPINFRLD